MRKEYIQQKGYKFTEMWECNWWKLYRTDATVKNHLQTNLPYQRPLSEERLLQEIKSQGCLVLFNAISKFLNI